jgi:hypothetical protein
VCSINEPKPVLANKGLQEDGVHPKYTCSSLFISGEVELLDVLFNTIRGPMQEPLAISKSDVS